jgi:DNA (cytosine-5)-methyltransferase 1
MRAMGHTGSHANAGGQLAVCITGDITHTIKAEGFDGSEDGTGRGQPIVTAMTFQERGRVGGSNLEIGGDLAYALLSPGSGGRAQERNVMTPSMAVRRLTPKECARLQGFPDSHLSSVIYKGKAPADGPMYKAFGNSMAVPCMAFIGSRIDIAIRSQS